MAKWARNSRAARNRLPFHPGAISDTEADITNDDPTINSTPQKITAAAQAVRKSFLHASWSEMSLASELSGRDALVRIQSRVSNYWDRRRLSGMAHAGDARVVVVTINYRLGVLGVLSHPALTAESAHQAVGNFRRDPEFTIAAPPKCSDGAVAAGHAATSRISQTDPNHTCRMSPSRATIS
jgi:hypothetical protein